MDGIKAKNNGKLAIFAVAIMLISAIAPTIFTTFSKQNDTVKTVAKIAPFTDSFGRTTYTITTANTFGEINTTFSGLIDGDTVVWDTGSYNFTGTHVFGVWQITKNVTIRANPGVDIAAWNTSFSKHSVLFYFNTTGGGNVSGFDLIKGSIRFGSGWNYCAGYSSVTNCNFTYDPVDYAAIWMQGAPATDLLIDNVDIECWSEYALWVSTVTNFTINNSNVLAHYNQYSMNFIPTYSIDSFLVSNSTFECEKSLYNRTLFWTTNGGSQIFNNSTFTLTSNDMPTSSTYASGVFEFRGFDNNAEFNNCTIEANMARPIVFYNAVDHENYLVMNGCTINGYYDDPFYGFAAITGQDTTTMFLNDTIINLDVVNNSGVSVAAIQNTYLTGYMDNLTIDINVGTNSYAGITGIASSTDPAYSDITMSNSSISINITASGDPPYVAGLMVNSISLDNCNISIVAPDDSSGTAIYETKGSGIINNTDVSIDFNVSSPDYKQAVWQYYSTEQIENSSFNVGDGFFLTGQGANVYINNNTWNSQYDVLPASSGEGTEVNLYGFSRDTTIYRSSGSGYDADVNLYVQPTINIVNQADIPVYVESAPLVVEWSGVTDQYGVATPSYLLYKTKADANDDGIEEVTSYNYTYNAEVPAPWNKNKIEVNDTTEGVLKNVFTNATWFNYIGMVHDYVVIENTTKALVVAYTGGNNSTIATEALPNSTVISENDIVVTNLDIQLRFTSFRFTAQDFLNGSTVSGISMVSYTMRILKNGVELFNLSTTNRTVVWNTQLDFGESLYLNLLFRVPKYAESGNYTSAWNLISYNDTAVSSSGTSGATIKASTTPTILLDEAPVDTVNKIQYTTGAKLAITTNIVSTNWLKVTNNWNGVGGMNHIKFTAFPDLTRSGGTETISLTNRIKVTRGTVVGSVFTDVESKTWDGSTALDFLVVMPQATSHYFKFIITDTNSYGSLPGGTYASTFSVSAVTTTGVTTATVTEPHEIALSTSVVSMAISYSAGSAVDFGALDSPKSTVSTSTNSFTLTNTGDLTVHKLVFTFSDMYKGGVVGALDKIPISTTPSNANLISGTSSAIPATGIVTLTGLTIAPTQTKTFTMSINTIPGGLPEAAYSGSFSVVYTYISASRAIEETSGTLFGRTGSADNSSNVSVIMSDGSSTAVFTSPLVASPIVGLPTTSKASARMLISNGDEIPLDRFFFEVVGGSSPCNYYMKINGVGTYIVPNNPVELIMMYNPFVPLGTARTLDLEIFVYTLDPLYNTSLNYSDQSIHITADRSFGLESTETVDVGYINLVVLNEPEPPMLNRTITVGAGIQTICWQDTNGTVQDAASFLEANLFYEWIAMWNLSQGRFIFYFNDGTGENFDLVFGTGYYVRSLRTMNTIEFNGEIPDPIYPVEVGIRLYGNVLNTTISASEILAGTSNIEWIAVQTLTGFETYFSDGEGTNFIVDIGEGFWIRAYGDDEINLS